MIAKSTRICKISYYEEPLDEITPFVIPIRIFSLRLSIDSVMNESIIQSQVTNVNGKRMLLNLKVRFLDQNEPKLFGIVFVLFAIIKY